MKAIYIKIIMLISSCILLASCTNGFTAINTDNNRIPENDYDFSMSDLGRVLRIGPTYNGADVHQRIKALGIDVFVQYAGGNASRNWTMDDGYQQKYWEEYYTNQVSVVNGVIRDANLFEGRENSKALALIWKTFIHSMFSDYFGPTPYSPDPLDENPDYMSLDKVYADFFLNLDSAMILFDPDKVFMTNSDPIYNSDMLKWKRFANTLRLRLALKVSEVDEALCKSEIIKAINGEGGLLQSNQDNATIGSSSGWGNQYPYYMYEAVWGEKQVMMQSMEWALTDLGGKAYDGSAKVAPAKVDPRGSKMFQPGSNGGIWAGLVAGMATEVSGARDLVAMMSTATLLKDDTKPTDIMLYPEACLLMAEAEERFNVGSGKSAKEWYEEGIKASFERWGITDAVLADYLVSTDRNKWGTSVLYGDGVAQPGNTNLEKIVTQRYIASYPDLSLQVWNDKRRLNLPAMFVPNHVDEGSGTYPKGGTINEKIKNPDYYISRGVYPLSERQINLEKYNAGIAQLKDGNKTSSPLWWASKRSNYCTTILP